MTLKEQIQAMQKKKGQTMSQEELQKTYFSIALPKGQTTGQKVIRILPGSVVFHIGYFHEIYIGKSKNKIYDPGWNDKERSPLNEVAAKLEAKGTEEAKLLAREYRPKKFYMLKVIERGKEADGPKWWRFKHDGRGQGVFDKILAIVERRDDIEDPEKGRDLVLTIQLKSYNKSEYSEVVAILPEDPSPLHTDKELVEQWLSDKTTWRDVYKKKPIEFLEILAAGKTPKWDSELGKYVAVDDEKASAEYGSSENKPIEEDKNFSFSKMEGGFENSSSNNTGKKEYAPQQEDDGVDDDLPF